jgi:hypothetical protein
MDVKSFITLAPECCLVHLTKTGESFGGIHNYYTIDKHSSLFQHAAVEAKIVYWYWKLLNVAYLQIYFYLVSYWKEKHRKKQPI